MNIKTELQKLMDENKLTHPLSNQEKKFVMNAMEKIIRQIESENEEVFE